MPPILNVLSKITDNSCELLTTGSLGILRQIRNTVNFIFKPKKIKHHSFENKVNVCYKLLEWLNYNN